MMGRSIGDLEAKAQGLQQLGVALETTWDALDVKIKRLINSMRQQRVKILLLQNKAARFTERIERY